MDTQSWIKSMTCRSNLDFMSGPNGPNGPILSANVCDFEKLARFFLNWPAQNGLWATKRATKKPLWIKASSDFLRQLARLARFFHSHYIYTGIFFTYQPVEKRKSMRARARIEHKVTGPNGPNGPDVVKSRLPALISWPARGPL